MGAHLFLATTAHARLLPVDARIAFRYRLIFLGLDLAQLETAASDLPPLFRYDARALTSLRPSAYLDERDPRPVQVKLGELLTARGIASDKWAALVYLVTMPAYLGFEGINPLSVYFCYATVPATEDTSAGRQLTVVVLEVHNTFGERHTYILECGVSEDTPSSGFVSFARCWAQTDGLVDIRTSGLSPARFTSHRSMTAPDFIVSPFRTPSPHTAPHPTLR